MPSYRGYRFPPETISHAVWLYHRFSLSFRDVEDLLAERGITVTYETIRQWCLTFGIDYARRRNRRAAIRFFRKLLKTQGGTPRRLITDKLPSYGAACRTVMPSVVHRTDQYLRDYNSRGKVQNVLGDSSAASGAVRVASLVGSGLV